MNSPEPNPSPRWQATTKVIQNEASGANQSIIFWHESLTPIWQGVNPEKENMILWGDRNIAPAL
jgi:hypothetical protein